MRDWQIVAGMSHSSRTPPMKYCEFCKCWHANNKIVCLVVKSARPESRPQSTKLHEEGDRHKAMVCIYYNYSTIYS